MSEANEGHGSPEPVGEDDNKPRGSRLSRRDQRIKALFELALGEEPTTSSDADSVQTGIDSDEVDPPTQKPLDRYPHVLRAAGVKQDEQYGLRELTDAEVAEQLLDQALGDQSDTPN